MKVSAPASDTIVTTFACVVAVLLAIAPAVGARWRSATYDPVLAIYTVTFMGVAWYTFFQRRTLRAQERALEYARAHDQQARADAIRQRNDERRATQRGIASAALAELQLLRRRLQVVVGESAPYNHHDAFSHAQLSVALRYPHLLEPATIQQLARLVNYLDEVQELMVRFRDRRQDWLDASHQLRREEVTSRNTNEVANARDLKERRAQDMQSVQALVQVKAWIACEEVPAVFSSLRALDGKLPVKLHSPELIAGSLPPLQPNPFDVASSDDDPIEASE